MIGRNYYPLFLPCSSLFRNINLVTILISTFSILVRHMSYVILQEVQWWKQSWGLYRGWASRQTWPAKSSVNDEMVGKYGNPVGLTPITRSWFWKRHKQTNVFRLQHSVWASLRHCQLALVVPSFAFYVLTLLDQIVRHYIYKYIQ